ncbi:hypothetical protein BDY21DRAFT_96645 [Lineolata rhizophorae]|uniref:Uncharacterized protein n=1 Tax=Lineolata rhizophorae TaxID=578093 RepID=A0A6A6NTZ3_9PEZI|nr:hypothetical protein BDY21DRAFT_96645 [Lineolata rhizophorae]
MCLSLGHGMQGTAGADPCSTCLSFFSSCENRPARRGLAGQNTSCPILSASDIFVKSKLGGYSCIFGCVIACASLFSCSEHVGRVPVSGLVAHSGRSPTIDSHLGQTAFGRTVSCANAAMDSKGASIVPVLGNLSGTRLVKSGAHAKSVGWR